MSKKLIAALIFLVPVGFVVFLVLENSDSVGNIAVLVIVGAAAIFVFLASVIVKLARGFFKPGGNGSV